MLSMQWSYEQCEGWYYILYMLCISYATQERVWWQKGHDMEC